VKAPPEPVFLELDEVLSLHASRIERYGGSYGLRDVGLLRSALAVPQATFDGDFLHGTLYEMAAAYLFHLVRNHPFVDGNKRVALLCALVFLGLNGLSLAAPPDALTALVEGAADGHVSKAEVAVFLQKHARVVNLRRER
jgi:death-on-curing protein